MRIILIFCLFFMGCNKPKIMGDLIVHKNDTVICHIVYDTTDVNYNVKYYMAGGANKVIYKGKTIYITWSKPWYNPYFD